MLVIDTRGKQAAAVVEKTPIEEDADVELDPLELAIRTKYVTFKKTIESWYISRACVWHFLSSQTNSIIIQIYLANSTK